MSVFGPVLPFDLVRMARRGRYVLLRCLYGLALLGLLYLTYSNHVISGRDGWADPRELANFAERFFFVFMAAQYVLILLLTPAYVGDSIAEEKQRRTLDYLLTTQLSIREIVLAKLTSRLAGVGLFLLAGLPVLSVTLLLGGVSPELLLGGFVATLLTMLSLAAVALCLSVYARQPRDAILQTYLVVLCYFVFWWLLDHAANYVAREFGAASEVTAAVDALQAVYNAGNLVAVMDGLQLALNSGGTYAAVLPELLVRYTLFHGVIALACTVWAMLRLRRVFATATLGTVKPRKERLWRRRRVGDRPMVWKEVHAEPGFRLGRLGTVLLVLLALACLAPGVSIVLEYANPPRATAWSPVTPWTVTYMRPTLGDRMNPYVRIAGTLLACVALLAVVVRAAGSVGAERDKQTLDGLLASLLDDKEILRAKWLGSVLSVRRLLGLLSVIWLLGVFTGGLTRWPPWCLCRCSRCTRRSWRLWG